MNVNMHNSDSPWNELEHNGRQSNTMTIKEVKTYIGAQARANTQKFAGCRSVTGVSSLEAIQGYLVVLA